MPKITLDRLKKIIREEVEMLHEGEDLDSAAKVMSSATKLLGAIESFKEIASEKAKSTLEDSGLHQVESMLKRIIDSPMQYVSIPRFNIFIIFVSYILILSCF